MKRTWIRRNERGQATMEFLILLPVLLAILGLIAYSGWWSYARLSAQNFVYADCVNVSRSRAYVAVGHPGFAAADKTRLFWQYQLVVANAEKESRLDGKDCQAILIDQVPVGHNGWWDLRFLAEEHGFSLYPPFMSCDAGKCQ